jgi:hypothetical protein
VDTGATLDVAVGSALWLIGGTETDNNGAILKGYGKVTAADTTIVGGPNGWQAVGDSIGIDVITGTPNTSVLKSGSSSTTVTTPTATLKALGSVLGATITQAAGTSGNNLTIDENTTIALGGTAQKKVGEIVLTGGSNPGKITLIKDTGKITTGNISVTTTSTGPLDEAGVTDVTANVIATIGVPNLVGNSTPGSAAKVITTAVVNTTDNDLMPVGNLVSLQGVDNTTDGTVEGGTASNNGEINSQTITNADNT